MELHKLTDEQLLAETLSAVELDRGSTIALLHHLAEIDRRNLHAEMGYASLFRYVVQALKYSESAAQRRISAMQLLRDLPRIEPKIASGALCLSTLARAQSFLRAEGIKSRSEKLSVLESLEGLSAREVDRELLGKSAHPEKLVIEKVRPVSEGWSEVTLLLENTVIAQIEEWREQSPASEVRVRMGEVVGALVREAVERRRARKRTRKRTSLPTSATKMATRSRYIPHSVRDAVRARDGNRCTYIHRESGKMCNSSKGLQFDHIIPYSNGGDHSLENLRLRCPLHNQHEALKMFGRAKMSKHVPRLSGSD